MLEQSLNQLVSWGVLSKNKMKMSLGFANAMALVVSTVYLAKPSKGPEANNLAFIPIRIKLRAFRRCLFVSAEIFQC